MIIVIATIDLNDGCRDAFLEEFNKIVPAVLEEDGCIEYGPTVDVETNIGAQIDLRANTVTIVEKWEDLQSLEAHLVAAHMMDYRPKVKPYVAQSSLQILTPAK